MTAIYVVIAHEQWGEAYAEVAFYDQDKAIAWAVDANDKAEADESTLSYSVSAADILEDEDGS